MKIHSCLAAVLLAAATVSASAQDGGKTVYLVSNAHFDSQWNWDVQTSIKEYVPKTMRRNFYLLEKFPSYVFNFEGAVKYAWMKEYYPYEYEKVKAYVADGRWHLTGSSWDAADTNIPSPESFSRNILYGQKFYMQEFGKKSTDLFLPDCFGFSYTMPSIASHFGLVGFSTQKLQWREKPFYGNSKIPFEIGLWQGIDGSRIMLVADGHTYSTNWTFQDLSKNESILNYLNNSNTDAIYHYFGTGDTGGSGKTETVRSVEYALGTEGPVRFKSATSDQIYFDYMPYDKHPELPVFDGELLMDVHGTGCYTSQAAMKMLNRRNEQMADAAERSAVAADWLGGIEYPADVLETAWKRFLWHQFHDDLTGTSIPRAYEFSWNDELISLSQFNSTMEASVGAVAAQMDTRVKGTPIVVYNPSGITRTDVITIDRAKVGETAWNNGNIRVYGPDGKETAVQTTGDMAYVVVKVPADGYAIYDLRKGRTSVKTSFKASVNHIENNVYSLTLDSNGDICSILDKRNGKELVEEGKAIRLALFTDNQSTRWPAWEIKKATLDQEAVSITSDVVTELVENGTERASIKITRRFGDSVFSQTVTLHNGPLADRIDIFNQIDWAEKNTLLKAEFPLSVSNGKARYDLGLGSVERPDNQDNMYEFYAHQWADLTDADGSYGVSVLNDSKYGWDKPDNNTIRLTLLHTPGVSGGYRYQGTQDIGHHEFTYSIVGHEGSYVQAGTVQKAEALNQPLKAFVTTVHSGKLGKTFSFAESENPSLSIRAVKKAEDGDGYIIRVYETSGEPATGKITFAGAITKAQEVDGNEDEISAASYNGNTLEISAGAFGIKSYRVEIGGGGTVQKCVSASLELPHKIKAASYNGFAIDSNFDGKGNSYAAELIPERITFKGVEFNPADPAYANATRCNGQVIALPEGKWNHLYMLAASMDKDIITKVRADGKEIDVTVPAYGGFIGQWGHTGHTEGYFKDTEIALAGTHKHSSISNEDLPYEFTYMFFIPVELPEGTKEIQLPKNGRVAVFAATVAYDTNSIWPASDHLRTGIPVKTSETGVEEMNILADVPVMERSGETRASEKAELAVDEDPTTKWCDATAGTDKYISFDLGKTVSIKGWSVLHAGSESRSYISSDFCLQVKSDESEEWRTVDSVTGNKENETERKLSEPVEARFVRLYLTAAEQNGGKTSRIYEFRVF